MGQAWLSNFHATEAPAATLLLGRLRFVGFSSLWTGLLDLLRRLESNEQLVPFVVYPERRLDSFPMDPEPAANELPVAWMHFVPGAPIIIPAGSDAFVAMVLKELRELGDGAVGGIPIDAELDALRDGRCRSIVLATDIVASGEQIEELAAAIGRNSRIRSWRSFGWLQIRVAAFAVMQDGLDRLTASRHVDTVDYLERVPTISSLPLSEDVREAVVRLCLRHAGGEDPLGFLDTGALFATERRAPDNVPGVFTRPGSPSWHPLFPGRSVPASFAAEVRDYRGNEPL